MTWSKVGRVTPHRSRESEVAVLLSVCGGSPNRVSRVF